MGSRLKTVKEPPLLGSPGTPVQWWLMTDSDRKTINGELEELRKGAHGHERLLLMYHMRELGLPVAVTDSDRYLIGGFFDTVRRDRHGVFIADFAHAMRKIGMDANLTQEALTAVTGSLKGLINLDLEPKLKSGQRTNVWRHLYHMRELGLAGDAPPEALEQLTRALDKARDAGEGYTMTELHYYSRMLGHPKHIRPEDVDLMDNTLNRVREDKDGLALAAMLHHLRDMKPPTKRKGETKEMPPLREYKR